METVQIVYLRQVVILKYRIRLKNDRHFEFVIPSECTVMLNFHSLVFCFTGRRMNSYGDELDSDKV